MKKVVINPVTRVNGFLEIDAIVDQNVVTNAITEGLLFRGFEKMLEDRDPFDAIYFTQRICGICSTAHSVASSMALENAMGIVPSEQGRYLRDLLHAFEFLQNHIRHFYQYTCPDYVKLPQDNTLFEVDHEDYRLPKNVNDAIVSHYFASMPFSRQAHEMIAILGGKAPHNHGIFVGGITNQMTTARRGHIKSLLTPIQEFIENFMVPDAYILADFYSDYLSIGRGSGNFLTFGCFNDYDALGTLFVDPSVYYNNTIRPLDPNQITENVHTAWYQASNADDTPFGASARADRAKESAYSWVKAPRYDGLPFEVGPLARMWLSGEYQRGISTMDRIIARALEAQKICKIIETLLDAIEDDVNVQSTFTIPNRARGAGLVDTTRGALGHWVKIENEKIEFYQLITPSAWNLSTRGPDNIPGPAEQALIGTYVRDENNAAELGRIIRSFDPCVSCATHVYTKEGLKKTIKVIP